MSNYLVKETLDFAEKVLFASAQFTEDRRSAAIVAIFRGALFLPLDVLNAAVRLLSSQVSAEQQLDSLSEFVSLIRQEIGDVTIDEDGIKGLWQSIRDIPEAKRYGEGK